MITLKLTAPQAREVFLACNSYLSELSDEGTRDSTRRLRALVNAMDKLRAARIEAHNRRTHGKGSVHRT